MISSETGTSADMSINEEQPQRVASSLKACGFVEAVAQRLVGQMVTIITARGVSITGVPHGIRSLDGVLTLDMDETSLPFSSIRLLSMRS